MWEILFKKACEPIPYQLRIILYQESFKKLLFIKFANKTVVRRANSEQNKSANIQTNEQIYEEINKSEFKFCSSLRFRSPFIHVQELEIGTSGKM